MLPHPPCSGVPSIRALSRLPGRATLFSLSSDVSPHGALPGLEENVPEGLGDGGPVYRLWCSEGTRTHAPARGRCGCLSLTWTPPSPVRKPSRRRRGPASLGRQPKVSPAPGGARLRRSRLATPRAACRPMAAFPRRLGRPLPAPPLGWRARLPAAGFAERRAEPSVGQPAPAALLPGPWRRSDFACPGTAAMDPVSQVRTDLGGAAARRDPAAPASRSAFPSQLASAGTFRALKEPLAFLRALELVSSGCARGGAEARPPRGERSGGRLSARLCSGPGVHLLPSVLPRLPGALPGWRGQG